MPYPLGHAAIGLVIESVKPEKKENILKRIIFIFLLATLSDIDVPFGLIIENNAWAYHGGATHSILFALFTALSCAYLGKKINWFVDFEFWKNFFIIISHPIADIIFSGILNHSVARIKSLFWPFDFYKSTGFAGWETIVNKIIFHGFSEYYIYFFSGLAIMAIMLIRQGIKNEGRKNENEK